MLCVRGAWLCTNWSFCRRTVVMYKCRTPRDGGWVKSLATIGRVPRKPKIISRPGFQKFRAQWCKQKAYTFGGLENLVKTVQNGVVSSSFGKFPNGMHTESTMASRNGMQSSRSGATWDVCGDRPVDLLVSLTKKRLVLRTPLCDLCGRSRSDLRKKSRPLMRN